MFSNSNIDLKSQIHYIESQVKEINEVFAKIMGPASSTTTTLWKQIKWVKPPKVWVKIKIDGNSNQVIGRAGCGGLSRDENRSAQHWNLSFF